MNAFFDFIRGLGFRRGPQRMLGGIAGGIAHRFNLSVLIVRILVLLSFLLPFVGVLLYVVLWAITPWQDGSIPLERSIRKK